MPSSRDKRRNKLLPVWFAIALSIFVGTSFLDIGNYIKNVHKESVDDSIASSTFTNVVESHEDITAATEATESDETNDHHHVKAIEKRYPILPSRVYSIIGLEDSGTKFVSSLITNALNQTGFREGPKPYQNAAKDELDVQVQHFSLPWGSSCQDRENVPIIDYVFPPQCYRYANKYEACGQMMNSLLGTPVTTTKAGYPARFNLDIVSQKEFYDSMGVEQYFIIVVREQNISRKARSKYHCKNATRLEEEERVGTAIMIDAINKYILNEEGVERQVTPENNFNFWEYHQNEKDRRRRLLSSSSSTISSSHGGMLHGNNVVLVSYESLMLLKDSYLKILFEILGIELNKMPDIKDGNLKYLS